MHNRWRPARAVRDQVRGHQPCETSGRKKNIPPRQIDMKHYRCLRPSMRCFRNSLSPSQQSHEISAGAEPMNVRFSKAIYGVSGPLDAETPRTLDAQDRRTGTAVQNVV